MGIMAIQRVNAFISKKIISTSNIYNLVLTNKRKNIDLNSKAIMFTSRLKKQTIKYDK